MPDDMLHNRQESSRAELEGKISSLIDQLMAIEKRAAEHLATEARYRALVEQLPGITYTAKLDDRRTLLYVSPQSQSILGIPSGDLLSKPDLWMENIHKDDKARVIAQMNACHSGDKPFRCEYRMLRHDGRPVWIMDVGAIVRDLEEGTPLCIQGCMFDITDMKNTEHKLASANDALLMSHRFVSMVLSTVDAIVLVLDTEGRIISINPACQRLTGFAREEVIGKKPSELFLAKEDIPIFENIIHQFANGTLPPRHETMWLTKTGQRRWVEWSYNCTTGGGGDTAQILAAGIDITARKEVEEKLREEATYDPLTFVFNRRYFMQQLEMAVALARRYSYSFCFCLSDIDHFKRINDTYGHHVGDEVLQTFGQIVRHEVRTVDIVGRYGGDEFGIAFPHTDATAAAASLERIRARFAEIKFKGDDGTPFSVTATFGVADIHPAHKQTADLMESADKALYKAKELGRNQIRIA